MRVLCAGSAGFIGQHLVRALVKQGHEVTATLHAREPEEKDVRVQYVQADLTVRAGWHRALEAAKPEIVYMVAGKTGGSGLNPLHFVTDNAIMALHMFAFCAGHHVKRIVAMSSTTGYPDIPAAKEDEYFIGDPHPAYFNPGHTRRFIERLAAMYPAIETVFLRCPGAYGPGDDFDPQSSHVIAATVRKVAERQDPITVWGDGSAVRDAVYIDDLVDALLRAADWRSGAYNLGFGFGMTVNQMLDTLLAAAKYTPVIQWDETKPTMIKSRLLDCNKAWSQGWHAQVPMREGLRRTLEWYEAQR